jgi:hypothetical protein
MFLGKTISVQWNVRSGLQDIACEKLLRSSAGG